MESPCKYCEHLDDDKKECIDNCKAIQLFQQFYQTNKAKSLPNRGQKAVMAMGDRLQGWSE